MRDVSRPVVIQRYSTSKRHKEVQSKQIEFNFLSKNNDIGKTESLQLSTFSGNIHLYHPGTRSTPQALLVKMHFEQLSLDLHINIFDSLEPFDILRLRKVFSVQVFTIFPNACLDLQSLTPCHITTHRMDQRSLSCLRSKHHFYANLPCS